MSVSYSTADVALREVADTVASAVSRLSQSKSAITTEKVRLQQLGTKYADVVTFVNANAQTHPDLKTRLDAIAADFNARVTTATSMETALAGIEI